MKKKKVKSKKAIGKITPIKKAFCPTCITALVKAADVDHELTLSGEWYCPKCNKLY